MINTRKKIRITGVLLILSLIIIAITASLWLLFSNSDKQQDKTYSGAKLIEQKVDYIFDWRAL